MADHSLLEFMHNREASVAYRRFDSEFRGERRRSHGEFLDSSGIEILDYAKPAYARLKAIRFDAFLAAHVQSRPMTVSWSRERMTARRRLMYIFVNKGTVEIRERGRSVSPLSGGVGVVFPGSGEVVVETTSDTEVLYFTFDASEIFPLKLEPDSLRTLSAGSPVFRVAYSFLCGAVHAPDCGDVTSAYVLRELTRDVARALALESSLAAPSLDTVERVRQVIERRYRSAAFTPEALAGELGLSRRSLERACAEKGFSIAEEVRAHRSRHALHLLLEQPELTLHEVAAASGFSSAEVMRRAFWRYYRSSPSAVRRTASMAEDGDVLAAPAMEARI